MTTETATPMIVRSAGRSRKGAGRYNWDFLCRVEYPAGSRIRGLYGVADGSPSPSRGDLASELAIEKLKEYFHHTRSEHSEGQSEASNLLKPCFSEINRTLLEHRIAKKEDEEEAYPMYSTLTAGYQIDNTFHIGHTGAGAVYMIEGGKIQRLTEEHRAAPPHEPSADANGAFAPGLLGWRDAGFEASFQSIRLEGSAVLVFCTDGITAELSSVALLEMWLETRSPEGMVERALNRLESRNPADDATMVVFQMETQREEAGKFVHPIRYPAHVIFKKRLVVLALLAALSSLVIFRTPIVGMLGARSAPPTFTAEEPGPGQPYTSAPRTAPAESAARETVFTLNTEPEDAAVFLEGVRLEGGSPHEIRIADGKPVSLRVERDGYNPLTTMIDSATLGDEGVSIRLSREQAELGSIIITCDGVCDEILLDGARVKAAFPRGFLHYTGVKPGKHEVKARSGGVTLAKKADVAPGKTAELRFEFPKSERAAATIAYASRPAAAPVRMSPPLFSRETAQAAEAERVNRVFFTVKTDTPNTALMIFQGGNLVLTGASGQRLDLPPGEYLIEAVSEGRESVTKKVYLNQRLQIVEMGLK